VPLSVSHVGGVFDWFAATVPQVEEELLVLLLSQSQPREVGLRRSLRSGCGLPTTSGIRRPGGDTMDG